MSFSLNSGLISAVACYLNNSGKIFCRSKKQAETDLVAMITQRRSERKEKFDSILSSVMAKCGGEPVPEPSEEEFEKARERLEARKKQPKRQKH